MKNTHEGVLILVKLQAEACNFTKINNPSWVFFTFFTLYKCYQIAQRITNCKYEHVGSTWALFQVHVLNIFQKRSNEKYCVCI